MLVKGREEAEKGGEWRSHAGTGGVTIENMGHLCPWWGRHTGPAGESRRKVASLWDGTAVGI